MALFKSQVYSEARGSVNGVTYSRNRYGAYTRNRAKPVNPSTTLQTAVRAAFTSISAAWRALTAGQRDAWTGYSLTVPKTNKVGDTINLTGNAMYVACNQPRVTFLGPTNRVDAAPTNTGTIPLSPMTTLNITSGTVVSVQPSSSDTWTANTNNALLVFASRPQNASIAFFKGPYQFAGIVRGTPAANITLPHTVSTGQVVFFAFRVLGLDGRISDQIRGSDTF